MSKIADFLKKISLSSWVLIFFYIFIFFLLWSHALSYLDPDLGWHLKVGEGIFKTGSVPTINFQNYTLYGVKWVDHEWLANLSMYLAYDNFGYQSLVLPFTIIAWLSLIILFEYARRRLIKNNGWWLILILGTIASISATPHFGVRIQEITVINLLLLLLIINTYTKKQQTKILWLIIPLLYFWSCLHGGFLIGIAVMAMWVGVKTLELISLKKLRLPSLSYRHVVSKKSLFIFSIFLIIASVSTLAAPYGLKLYGFLLDYKNTFYLSHIQEWLPQWDYPYNYWQCTYLALTVTALGLNIIHAVKNKKNGKINLWETSLIIVMLALAFKSRRHTPLLVVSSFPFLMKSFAQELEVPKNYLKKNHQAIIKIFLIVCLSLLSLSEANKINFAKNPFNRFCEDKMAPNSLSYPCAAINFLKEHPELKDKNMLNEFSWGGFLIWDYPERLLFIDGRFPQYPYEDKTIIEEYWGFSEKDKVPQLMQKHHIELVLARKFSPQAIHLSWLEKNFLLINEKEINNNEKKNELESYLESSSDWQKIYNDQLADIYVKK